MLAEKEPQNEALPRGAAGALTDLYSPPSTKAGDQGPQPAALCARTTTDQSGMSLTENEALRFDPPTVWLNVPPPSLPRIVIWYWSVGLSPGTAPLQLASRVSGLEPGASQRAVTPVGAEGATDAGCVVARMGADGGLDPPALVLTT